MSRAISFDLDGTLLDNAFIPETIAACCELVAARLGVAPDLVAAANAAAWADHWPQVEAGWALGSPSGAVMVREVWRRALASCGCDEDDVLEELLAEQVRLDRANARLFPDVEPVIATLRSRGHPLALITNGASDTQRARIESLGIADWFDVVVISAEVGAVKPDARVFRIAAEGLGVSGPELWHVGDNLETDVAGARSAGHTAVWLNRAGVPLRRDDLRPDVELRSLSGLPAARLDR